MAGEWIKVEHVTPDKPEVHAMAAALGIAPEHVVGCLVRVWAWADQQSLDGHAVSVTAVTLDRIACHAGFAHAMRDAGWLTELSTGLSFPNFERHNTEPAKKRALAADRKRRERSRKSHAESVTRGEERRGEGSLSTSLPDGDVSKTQKPDRDGSTSGRRRASVARPADFTLTEERSLYAETVLGPTVDAAALFEHFCTNHASKDSRFTDWDQAWRTWVQKALQYGFPKGTAGQGGGTGTGPLSEAGAKTKAAGERWLGREGGGSPGGGGLEGPE